MPREAHAATPAEVPAARWDALLDELGCPDAYLRRGYLEAACELVGAEPTLLHLAAPGGDVVFACLLRDAPLDVTTPYGYGGPVAAGADPPARAFSDGYERWARDRGVVSSFVVFHPLYANQRYAPASFELTPLAGTVAWRLDEPGDLLASMHRHHRRAVRRAQREGLEVEVDGAPARLDEFVALYEATMRRNGAAPFYFFPPAYWAALARGVPLLRLDARRGGELLASILCLPSPPWLHYHLGAVADAGRGLGASHLLLYTAACWAREHGCSAFHLGGGVGGRADALLEFKRRFFPDGVRASCIGRAVHDAARYRELSGAAATDGDFFPAYRRRG